MGLRKKNMEQYKRILMFVMSIVILSALTALFGCIWYEQYADVIIQPFFRRGNWLVVGIYALLLYIFTHIYGGYRVGYLKCGDIVYSSILSMFFVNVITYLQVSLIGRRLMNAGPFVVMTLLDGILIAIWAICADRMYKRLYPPHQMLLIYGSNLAESLIYKMNTRVDKYDICEAINIEEGLAEVYRRIANYEAVIICDVKSEARNQILKYCFARSIRTYLTPKISDTIVRGAEMLHLFDTPLLLCRNQGLGLGQKFIKRVIDLLLSVIAFVIASPFMLAVAVAVKVYDGGPVFYKQKRLTIGGKVFEVYKFRSMVVDAEKHSGAKLASKNDSRITPVGKFIRKVRLDELPQIINIIKGDMTIVGPRPERPEIAMQYNAVIPEFDFRLKVKAGLTGYAQVLGKYNTTPYDKLKLDLMYIENYSLLLDIKLMMMTVKILFLPESTEGVSEGIKVPNKKQELFKDATRL